MQIGQGLCEFQREVREGFTPFGGFVGTRCADVCESVPAIRRIEHTLDEFFTIRSTLRLLGPSSSTAGQELHAMQELLSRAPHSLRRRSLLDDGHVGAVCLDTQPPLILVKAFNHAHKLCRSRCGQASELLVNGVPSKEFLLSGAADDFSMMAGQFAYVDLHLYYIFFEVLKNALFASVRKVGDAGRPPPIHVSMITGTSLTAENDRAIKISDSGEGIRREDVKKVFSYFYPTQEGDEVSGGGGALPIELEQGAVASHSSGLGLPVSRVLARYFGGEIDLHSLFRAGTDVYIYL